MVYENNVPKTETIYELKNEVLSFEEFMKIYQPNEKSEVLAEAEYQDRVLNGPQYGPGAEQSKTIGKAVLKTATAAAATGLIIGTGGAATPFVIGGAGAALAGEAFRRAGEQDGNEVVE